MASKEIRPIRVEGNIAYVPLTQGYDAVIDAADVPLVEWWNWCALVCPRTVYAVRGQRAAGVKRLVYLHRVIVQTPDDLETDHKDGNGLNNMRSNLRTATRAQNQQNQRTRSDNASGAKGVSWDKQAEKWRADIRFNGKRRFLGYFRAIEDARIAYAVASQEAHGSWGRAA